MKAHKQHKRCSGVFIVNFRGVGTEDPVKYVRWNFFLQFKGQKLKFSINFQMGSNYTYETLNRFYFN